MTYRITRISASYHALGEGETSAVVLMMLCHTPVKRLVGTDLFHAAILAGICSLGHMWAGNVDFYLAALILLGSIPGVNLGSHLTIRVPEVVVRISVALVLAFSGTRLIIR